MCIIFIYNAFDDQESDYSLIIATNRDEYYDRPSINMSSWKEYPHVYGGRDMEAECQGTWLAYSSLQNKLGVLLNLPGVKKVNAKSRGKIVADYVINNSTIDSYIQTIQNYVHDCNEFILVAIEIRNNEPLIQTYNNATNKLEKYNEACVGFSNSLPNNPLKKVEEGKKKMKDICEDHKKLENKAMLIEKLIDLLKWEERHLPDQVLQNRKPNDYHWFSSVFVTIPPVRYGTRTHTLLLVTKSGQVDLIEIYLQSPIDLSKPEWKRSDFQFNIKPNV
ncbi:transport and Golgi organization protein 2 isoform X1 [Colias croceus]|uniref:transport and Golgi organization protein 2 isoform X1 n=1 Tax=Colias crocea TaxID=72248 RepID=UPI001E27BD48|nr:transport and Golgi organization protein 2 isoform X1 [Colias croceus]